MSENTTVVKIESSLPVFTADFEGEKKRLKADLEKYKNVLVTEETLKDDKKLAQQLTARGREYSQIRKDKVKEVSAPIQAFQESMNELTGLCADVAIIIGEQVKVFEDAKLMVLDEKLNAFLMVERDVANIQGEHRISEIDKKLIKLGSITAKGALTKGAKDAVIALVATEQARQQRTEYRLLQLESESHKAGLHSPLVRVNVESFLFADDEAYKNGLDRIVQSELTRQQQAQAKIEAEAKLKAEAEIKAKQKADDEAEALRLSQQQHVEDTPVHEPEIASQLRESANVADKLAERFGGVEQHDERDFGNATGNEYDQYAEQQMAQQPQVEQQQTGKMSCTVTAQFKVSVPVTITAKQITDKLTKMLSDAGITSLHDIKVSKDA